MKVCCRLPLTAIVHRRTCRGLLGYSSSCSHKVFQDNLSYVVINFRSYKEAIVLHKKRTLERFSWRTSIVLHGDFPNRASKGLLLGRLPTLLRCSVPILFSHFLQILFYDNMLLCTNVITHHCEFISTVNTHSLARM